MFCGNPECPGTHQRGKVCDFSRERGSDGYRPETDGDKDHEYEPSHYVLDWSPKD